MAQDPQGALGGLWEEASIHSLAQLPNLGSAILFLLVDLSVGGVGNESGSLYAGLAEAACNLAASALSLFTTLECEMLYFGFTLES